MNEWLKHTDRFHRKEMKLYLCLNPHNKPQIEKLQSKRNKSCLHPQEMQMSLWIVNTYLEYKALCIIANSNTLNIQGLHKHCNLIGYAVIVYSTVTFSQRRGFVSLQELDYCMGHLSIRHTLKPIKIEEKHRSCKKKREAE